MANTPRIRFKGFTDDWEQRKLGEIYHKIGNAFVGTATPYYVESGHFYLESNNIKDGQINNNTKIFINNEFYEKQKEKWLHTGDMVMVQSGHVGHSAVIPKELDNIAAHALIMFKKPKIKIEPYFLNYQYQTLKSKKKIDNITTGNTIKHILASDMQEFEVDVASYDEQVKIADYFQYLDHLITLHQRKCDETKKLKKYMLQKMFPKNGEKNPEIRFAGFTDDWEQRKLGDVGKCQSGIGFPDAEQGGKSGTPFYKVSDMNNYGNEQEMTCANNYVTDEQIIRKNWKPITEVPAVIFAKVGAAIMLNRKRLCRFPFLLDNNTMAYKFGEKWDTNFGKTLFEKIDLTELVQVGALPSFNATDVENIDIKMPTDMNEQRVIGQYFANLDHLITLHQRKCDNLKLVKKFMLQNMFPKKG